MSAFSRTAPYFGAVIEKAEDWVIRWCTSIPNVSFLCKAAGAMPAVFAESARSWRDGSGTARGELLVGLWVTFIAGSNVPSFKLEWISFSLIIQF